MEDRLVVEHYAQRIKKLEPWLKKTVWAPMTYMMMPNVLHKTKQLIRELASYDGPQKEEISKLLERLEKLRDGFRRET